jgi:sarcosine oxidase, subunit gamma
VVETYLRQSPLAQRALDTRIVDDAGDAGLAMAERRFLTKFNVRGQDIGKKVKKALGVELPVVPNTTAQGNGLTALWLGPDEWLIVGPPGAERALTDALAGTAPAVTDVSEGRTAIRISGPMARDVMAMGCPLDLDERVFGTGQCAQSHMARTTIIVHQVADDPAYDIYVERSQADYLWTWLEHAGAPYGVAVVAEPHTPSSWRRPAKAKKSKDGDGDGDVDA